MKKTLQSSFLIILFIAAAGFIAGCNKKGDSTLPIPTVAINPIVSDLTPNTVTVSGRNTSANVITENGICYSSTNKLPTTNDVRLPDTLGARWQSKITSLAANTTYYIRAYAVNDTGTGYSDVLTITTPATLAAPTGTVTTFAGNDKGLSGYVEGTGTGALFDGPAYVSFNPTNNLLYVSDTYNNAIRFVTLAGATSSVYFSTVGYADGASTQARFYGPKGISFDVAGNAYVADIGNSLIRKITTATGAVSTLAGNTIPGYIDGDPTKAEFNNPTATAVDAAGNVYVADRTNNLIRKITPAGVVSVLAGFRATGGYPQNTVPGYLDGDGATAVFNYPVALAIDATGNLFVADYKNRAIRKVSPTGNVTTLAGGLNYPNLLGTPTGVAVDTKGNVYVSEASGRILEISTNNILYVLAGAPNASGYINGVGKEARFNNPQSLTLDSHGNLYVADYSNNAIRKITIAVQ